MLYYSILLRSVPTPKLISPVVVDVSAPPESFTVNLNFENCDATNRVSDVARTDPRLHLLEHLLNFNLVFGIVTSDRFQMIEPMVCHCSLKN
jgi:hypothetical protein